MMKKILFYFVCMLAFMFTFNVVYALDNNQATPTNGTIEEPLPEISSPVTDTSTESSSLGNVPYESSPSEDTAVESSSSGEDSPYESSPYGEAPYGNSPAGDISQGNS